KGQFQLVLAFASRDVFAGVKTREMLAQDLVDAVTLEALGSAVPRCDAAVAVEHENGVIFHAFDQQAKVAVGGKQVAHVAMLGVDAANVDVGAAGPEAVEAVRAEKSEGKVAGKLVPQSLEPNRGVLTPFAPEDVDHF